MINNRRVLAIMPHPDDIEFLCAGTLLRLRESGWEIHCATMTAGDKGSAALSRIEIASVRRDEAAAASSLLGAESYSCLEFADLEIVFDNEARKRVAGLLRRIDPGIVITTPPQDYMFDHEITSHLVRDACFNAGVPNYETNGDHAPITSVPYLYYSDPIGGHDLFGVQTAVSVFIDITGQIEQKARALLCHESQRSWLQKQHGLDNYEESMRSWCAARGNAAGYSFAEGFRQHLGHPYPQDDLLKSILNGR